jgi:ribosomal protein S18 acetylase RimI-like enzyme
MSRPVRQGLSAARHLTAKAQSEIQALVAECKSHEPGLDLPLYLQPAGVGSDRTDHFGYYHDGALVGFASLSPGDDVEVQCVVHPSHRRKGIGRALVHAAQQECAHRGTSRLTLVCETAAQSGLSFAQAMGAAYRFSEHRMELDRAAYARHQRPHKTLAVEPADMRDVDALVAIGPASGDTAPGEDRGAILRWFRQADRQYYIGRLQGEPIGMLRVGRYPPEQAFIESFKVRPEHRERGYGRQILTDVIDRLIAEEWGRILIEVATDNDVALSLYRSCGFQKVATYLYYELPCSTGEEGRPLTDAAKS